MTEPLLEYRGSLMPPPSNWRIGAWIYLMILGILYGVGSLCIGASFGVAIFATKAAIPGSVHIVMFILTVGLACVGLGIAATYIWSGFGIKRGSKNAAVVALIVGVVNTVLIVGLLAIMGVAAAHESKTEPIVLIIGIGFYGFVAAINGAGAWLAYRVMRECR
jgi:hypothetical protein